MTNQRYKRQKQSPALLRAAGSIRGNICSVVQGLNVVRFMCLEHQNKYFPYELRSRLRFIKINSVKVYKK